MQAAFLAAMTKSTRSIIFLLCFVVSGFAGISDSAGHSWPAFPQGQAADPPPNTFTIVGIVRTQSGQTVNGVRFTVLDDGYQSVQMGYVDLGGRFTVRKISKGKYIVRIETSGTPYEEESQQIELSTLRRFGGDETFTMEFRLRYKKGNEPPSKSGTVFAQEVPKAARAEFERGANSLKGNKSQAAIAALQKAVELFPDFFEALELLGVEYTKAGQFESAVETLTKALKVNSRAPRSMYAIGVAHLNLHQHEEAIEWLNKTAQIDSASANTQMMLGLAYGNSGILDKAETAFKKALQLGGEGAAEAHFYLAGLFNKLGKYKDARQELQLFLKESKNVKEPAQIKAMIEKLKEKENAKPAMVSASSISSSAAAASGPAIQTETLSDAQNQPPTSTATPLKTEEAAPLPANAEGTPPTAENSALLINPVQPLPPEAAELLQQSSVMGGTTHRQLLDYTYILKKTRRTLDERGNPSGTEEQMFEAYPIRGEHVLIRLSTNGIPSRTLAEDRKRAVKQLEEAERRGTSPDSEREKVENLEYVSAGVSGIYGGNPGYVSINLSAFLRACEFFSPRTEKIAEREMLVLSFRRRAGVTLPINQSYISKLVGTIWIDQADKIVTRLEAWPATQAAFDFLQSTAPRDDAALIYQQQRQSNGLWFPTLIHMNAGGRKELFNGLNWDVLFEFSGYHRFNTDSTEQILNPANKKP